MSGKLFFKNYKIALAFLAVLFILLSLAIHLSQNFFLFRLLRGILCYTTLLYLWIAHRKHIQKWVVGFLLFYGASSIATLWFENIVMAALSMILNFVAFTMLFWYVLPKISLKYLSKTFTLLFILMVLVNGYLFIQFIELLKDMALSKTQYIFMVLSAL